MCKYMLQHPPREHSADELTGRDQHLAPDVVREPVRPLRRDHKRCKLRDIPQRDRRELVPISDRNRQPASALRLL